MDRELSAKVVGGCVGVVAAGVVLATMFGEGGGLGLPSGRYPIILLAALVIGPPLIAGAVAGGIAFAITFAVLKPVEVAADAKAQRLRTDNVARIKAVIEAAPEGDVRDYAEKTLLPLIKKTSLNLNFGSDVPAGYSVFHVAAAVRKPSLIEVLAALKPHSVQAAENGKHFDEIGSEADRSAARAAFARGYWAALQRDIPSGERPVRADENAFCEEIIADHIERNRKSRWLSFDIDPGFMVGLARRNGAETLLDTGQADRALPLLESARRLLDRHSSLPKVLMLRGRAHSALGNRDKALQDFNAAIERDGKLAEAFWRRGRTLKDAGRYSDAIADYDRAIANATNYPSFYIDRGALLVNQLGHPQYALADFRKALELDPGNEVARDNIEAVLRENGADAASIAALSAKIEADPRDVDALWRRASGYRISGDTTRANADIAAALAISPSHVGTITERYRIARDAGKWALAHIDAVKLEELEPNETWPLACSALCLEHLGKKAEALSLHKRILAVKPDNATARDGVARLGGAAG